MSLALCAELLSSDEAANGKPVQQRTSVCMMNPLDKQVSKRRPMADASGHYADALLALLKNASKSALIWSFRVEGMPCGAPS